MMFILKQGNKTVGMTHNDRSYVFGFSKVVTARKIQYNLHPEPQFTLIRDPDLLQTKSGISFDHSSTLFIPKASHDGGSMNPMNDIGLHLSELHQDTFYSLPAIGVGIIIPYKLKEEDETEFIYDCFTVDPYKL